MWKNIRGKSRKKALSRKFKENSNKAYTDGVEIAVISRSLEVPYETVRSWIRAEGERR